MCGSLDVEDLFVLGSDLSVHDSGVAAFHNDGWAFEDGRVIEVGHVHQLLCVTMN